MLPAGCISHEIPGRMRVQIPERRRDEQFFVRVRQELAAEQGIRQVSTNPLTGSVLLFHDLDAARLAAIAETHQLFRLVQSQLERPPRTRSGTDGDHRSFGRSFGGSFAHFQPSSHYGRLALALVGLAAFEAMQGNVRAPAVTVLWYALRLWQRSVADSAPLPGAARQAE